MANINVLKGVERVEKDLRSIVHHISLYSGIPKEHASRIGRLADEIADMAKAISHDSNEMLLAGKREPSKSHKVRRGY